MAQYNSLIAGRATGRIGNVVFVRGVQQNVVRSVPESVKVSQSARANSSRSKFRNTAYYWRLIRPMVQKARKFKKGKGNYYHAFMSSFKEFAPDFYTWDNRYLQQYFQNCSGGFSVWSDSSGRRKLVSDMIYSVRITDESITMKLYDFNLPYFNDILVNVYLTKDVWNPFESTIWYISPEEWNTKVWTRNLNLSEYKQVFVYLTARNGANLSDWCFSNIKQN